MEQRALIASALGLVVIGSAVGWFWSRHHAPTVPSHVSAASDPRFDGNVRVHVDSGTRITVEIVNATHLHGLARRGTFYLRDRGFDVVSTGTDLSAGADSMNTIVFDRTHHPEWARLAANALGHARVEERPDSLRDVDLTVRLGATWRPPAQPFYP